MAKNITVPKTWQELNDWQLQEIAHLYLHVKEEKFYETFQKMVFIIFQGKKSFWAKLKFYRLLRSIPFAELAEHGRFLLETTNYYTFPEINGLIAPAPRITNITSKQFSFIDRFFHDWEQEKTELKLRRFAASLYRISEKFNEYEMPKIAELMAKIPVKKLQVMALAYKFTRYHIWESYPIIYPKPKEPEQEQELKPVFKKPNQYQSFDKIIMRIVFSEEKPLGNKHEADETLIYPFLNVLTEVLIRNREKAQ